LTYSIKDVLAYFGKKATFRNDYTSILNMAKETKEPIYITKNGEGDLVVISIDSFEKREQISLAKG
jgi:prevent-host-death family protein